MLKGSYIEWELAKSCGAEDRGLGAVHGTVCPTVGKPGQKTPQWMHGGLETWLGGRETSKKELLLFLCSTKSGGKTVVQRKVGGCSKKEAD